MRTNVRGKVHTIILQEARSIWDDMVDKTDKKKMFDKNKTKTLLTGVNTRRVCRHYNVQLCNTADRFSAG